MMGRRGRGIGWPAVAEAMAGSSRPWGLAKRTEDGGEEFLPTTENSQFDMITRKQSSLIFTNAEWDPQGKGSFRNSLNLIGYLEGFVQGRKRTAKNSRMEAGALSSRRWAARRR